MISYWNIVNNNSNAPSHVVSPQLLVLLAEGMCSDDNIKRKDNSLRLKASRLSDSYSLRTRFKTRVKMNETHESGSQQAMRKRHDGKMYGISRSSLEVHPEPVMDESRCCSPYKTQEHARIHPFFRSAKMMHFPVSSLH